MKKITKFLSIILMAFTIVGCSCSDKECNCPTNEQNTTEENYTTINNGYKDLYTKTTQSVVMVKIQEKNSGEMKATGSGVVFFEQGDYAYILTNAHVVKELNNSREIEVFFSDENGFMSGKSEIAILKGKDYYEDVAVLQIGKSTKYKVATIGDSSKVEKGDFVYTIGSPDQKFNHTTSVTISNYNTKINIDTSDLGVATPVYAILFDAPINKGNSGGALFNSNGELIGITTLKYIDLESVYGALPINYFIKVAKYLLVNNKNYTRPKLNITTLSINEMGILRDKHGISNLISTGVYVQNSLEGEIVNQSVITEVNGVKIRSNEDFQVELLKYDVGTTIRLTLINKDGLNKRQVNITLHQ
jgi:serine protease Do